MAELELPFAGLATGWVVLFTVALVVICAMLAWNVVLFVRAEQVRRRAERPPEGKERGYTWVFLVPALNEEVTIRDSVSRLLQIPVAHRRVLVIDDGSDDATPDVLAEIDHPDLHVLRRDPPNARQGKAAALNHAYRVLTDLLSEVERERGLVVVVDADGRLSPSAPSYAAPHFDDPRVGGVQSLVRIYNRDQLLTWLQDVEFSVYGCLFQAGRNAWGTAGMGGNGQFNRLRALDDVASDAGPWRERLTEDQDLGLRLMAAGWHGRQELRAVVEQQGVPRVRPLFRQRTRWSQGNLQAMSLMGALRRSPLPRIARVELIAYLLMPLWQGIVGIALLLAVALALTNTAPFWAEGPWWQLIFIYLLGFGATMLGCIAGRHRAGARGWLLGFLIGNVYAFYSWMLWPVLGRSAVRQLTERRDWTKTEREPLESGAADARTS